MKMDLPLFTPLASASDPLLFGSKTSRLSTLLKAGFPVPEGFAFSSELHRSAADPSARNEILAKASLELDSLLKADTPYMVRSSAIGEDGKTLSYAGQLDSFRVGSTALEVITAIEKCWASFHSPRVLEYQKIHGVRLGGMSVLVQRMIDPKRAGVLFTTAPDKESHLLVESVEGHCEKLVQGEVDPDRALYARNETPLNLHDAELMTMALAIERLFESPQDIEWARDDSGVWIVQSRPITTFRRRLLWSNTNLNENYPDRCDPLLASIARESYFHYFKNITRRLLPGEDTAPLEKSFRNVVGFWGDRMYYCMTAIHEIIARSPMGALLNRSFDDFVGHRGEHPETKIRKGGRLLRFSGALIKHLVLLPAFVRAFERLSDRHIANTESSGSFSEHSRDFYRFLDIRFYEWYRASFADFFSMLFHGALGTLTKKIHPEAGAHHQNALVQGIPDLVSTRPILRMWKMRTLILSDSFLNERFSGPTPPSYAEMEEIRYSTFKPVLDLYLKEWGFRCSGELQFLSENYSEKPDSFLSILHSYVKTDQGDPALIFVSEKKKYRLSFLSILTASLRPGKLRYLPLIAPTAWLARYSVSCRERVRLKQAHLYSRFKITVSRLGAFFSEKGLLANTSDIFFLSFKEIDTLLSEAGDLSGFSKIAADRRKAWETSEVYPDEFTSYGFEDGKISVAEPASTSSDGKTFRGIAASRGKVKGRAVLMQGVHEASRLKTGDILVTRQTDPGWICVFPIISGIVIERGGMLSHGAIVAREFGISAVVGVAGATQKIPDESMILVDGDEGVVCLL